MPDRGTDEPRYRFFRATSRSSDGSPASIKVVFKSRFSRYCAPP